MEKKQITQEQIDAWKSEHKNVYRIDVGDKVCYLKQPSRRALSFAAAAGQTDPLRYNEIILKDCWLAGDEEIQTDNGLFLSISAKLPELIEIKESALVKL